MMKHDDARPILVAGGGIGGLAAALGLARARKKVIVLERAAEFGEIGAGFELAPNAIHALDYLGLGTQARAAGCNVDSLVFMDAMTGDEIFKVPTADPSFLERFGNPWVTTHRRDLHNVLLAAARRSELIELRTSSEAVGYTHTANDVSVSLRGGQSVTGEALIGADGVRSSIRQQMVGDDVVFCGDTAYRSLIPADLVPAGLEWLRSTTTMWGGDKCHIITYPLSGTKLINLVLVSSDVRHCSPDMPPGQPIDAQEVFSRFSFTHDRVKSVFTLATDFKVWQVGDRDPIARWCDGRVALLGDAAHPMLQYLAQGACQALEDAVRLSKEFAAGTGAVEDVLLRYVDKRMVRACRVQLMSRAVGIHVWHPNGPHAAVRNDIFKHMSLEEFYGRMQWLWGGDQHSDSTLQSIRPVFSQPSEDIMSKPATADTGLFHLAIKVKDVEESDRFYVEVIGLVKVPRPPVPFPGSWLAPREGAEPIIHTYGGPPAYVDGVVPTGTAAVDHVALSCRGWDAFLDRVQKSGQEWRYQVLAGTDLWQIYIHDPSGTLFELTFFGTQEERGVPDIDSAFHYDPHERWGAARATAPTTVAGHHAHL